MGAYTALLLLHLVYLTSGDQLHTVFEWNQLDFQYPSPEARQQAIDSKTFIPENNLPMGVEVFEDRLFVTVPSLYVAAHNSIGNDGKPPEIISPFRVRVDKCQRLWVLDSGKMGSLDPNATRHTPSIIVYDLKTDNLLRRYQFPADQVKEESGFATLLSKMETAITPLRTLGRRKGRYRRFIPGKKNGVLEDHAPLLPP
ncbi:hypothetical protein MSG28_010047 [Choristoneura fumiferana]|uniref:Uncharacterized protein n=1 Tax=Choristoneura fumiferana TaxID=7141 RepID=A0ACC0KIX5_CHOFU|nr:hypothetical protein MSG28_010047 [Choristoneura fumiferana]